MYIIFVLLQYSLYHSLDSLSLSLYNTPRPSSSVVSIYTYLPYTTQYDTIRYDIYMCVIMYAYILSCTRAECRVIYYTAGVVRVGCVDDGCSGLRPTELPNRKRARGTTGARRFRSWPTLCFVRLIIRQKSGTTATETTPPPRKRYTRMQRHTDRATTDHDDGRLGVQIFIIIILLLLCPYYIITYIKLSYNFSRQTRSRCRRVF